MAVSSKGFNKDSNSVFENIEAMLIPVYNFISDGNYLSRLTDIVCNPNGRVFLNIGRKINTGIVLDERTRRVLMSYVAGLVGEVVNYEHPSVNSSLSGNRRFQGWVPPVVSAPAFCIRIPSTVVFSLHDLVGFGMLSYELAEYLRQSVIDSKNILIAGATGSGKTTLVNSLLQCVPATDRLVIIEDNPEIRVSLPDVLFLLTSRYFPTHVALSDALRAAPDRIIVGEIRDGNAALLLAKALTTGHRGGLSTVHAGGISEVVGRIRNMFAEVVTRPDDSLFYEAFDLVLFVCQRREGGTTVRRLDSVGVVDKHNHAVVDLRATPLGAVYYQ